jgi:hypothetical protein
MSLSNFDKLKEMFKFYEQSENSSIFDFDNEYRCLLRNLTDMIYIGNKYFYSIVVAKKEVDLDDFEYEDIAGYINLNDAFEIQYYEFNDYEIFYEVFEKVYKRYEEDLAFENEKEQKRFEGIKKFMGEDFVDD